MTQLTEAQIQEIEDIAAYKVQGDSINSHDGLCVDDLRALIAEVWRLRSREAARGVLERFEAGDGNVSLEDAEKAQATLRRPL